MLRDVRLVVVPTNPIAELRTIPISDPATMPPTRLIVAIVRLIAVLVNNPLTIILATNCAEWIVFFPRLPMKPIVAAILRDVFLAADPVNAILAANTIDICEPVMMLPRTDILAINIAVVHLDNDPAKLILAVMDRDNDLMVLPVKDTAAVIE
jgi:hypothetical protein